VKRGSGSFTLANSVTLFRLCLVPVFIYMLTVSGDRRAALGVFVLMALADGADGIIARMRREESLLGAVLDPAADKVLLLTSYILLSGSRAVIDVNVPEWLALLVVGRDVYIIVGAGSIKLLTGTLRMAPSLIGKTSTFAQMSTVVLALSGMVRPDTLRVAYVATGMLTLASGIDYTLLGAEQLRRNVSGSTD